MKSSSVTIAVNASQQYFPVMLFITLYRLILTFESVDKILKCDHSNELLATEQYFPVLTFEYVVEILNYDLFK